MEQGSEQQNESQFEADAQIGKGLRFIDRNGVATIADGRLTLRKRNGDVIVQAPISEVRAEAARFSGGGAVRIWIGDEGYSVEPLRVHRVVAERLGGAATNLGRDVKRLKKGRELTQIFLAVVEAEGGKLGKP
ncbi:MAG: hypothetical protein ABSG64_00185 [Solirubrobacteraceae bacterium]|jgi:hypothetical protein